MMVSLEGLGHPLAGSETVNIYCVVASGAAVGVRVVALVKPVSGAQVKLVPLMVALSWVEVR